MKDEPDIVKELKEAERLGILQSRVQSAYEELNMVEEPSDDIPDETIAFNENDAERKKTNDDNNIDQGIAEETLGESDEYLRTIFESSKDGIVIVNEKGVLIDFNKALVDMLGYTSKELKKRNYFGLTPDEFAHLDKNALKQALDQGYYDEFEKEFVRKDGTRVPVIVTGGIVGGKSKTTHWKTFAFIKDIAKQKKANEMMMDSNRRTQEISQKIKISNEQLTKEIKEHKNAEEKLKENEEKFRDLFENANDLIQSVDANGDFIYVNKKWRNTLGYSEKDIKKLKLTDVLRNDQIPHCMEIFKRVCNGETLNNAETIFMTKDGRETYVEGNVNPWFKDGKFIATRAIFRDITKQKQIEKEIKIKESAIETSINAIAIAELDGRLTYANQPFQQMWGYKDKKEIIGMPLVKFWKKKGMYVQVLDAVTNEGGWMGELVAERNDGSLFDVQLSASIVKNKDGEPLCMMTSFVDITDRKLAAEALKVSRASFINLVENNPEGILVIGLDGIVQFVNSTVEKLFGRRADELIGELFGLPMAPDKMIEVDIIRSDGKPGIAEMRVDKARWEDKEIYLVSLLDITERKKGEIELEKYSKNLEIVNENLDSFAYSVSHDLRAPLRAIAGFSQVVLDEYGDKVDDELRHYLDRINTGTQKMGELIDDLLHFSRTTRGEINYETVDVKTIINEVIKQQREMNPDRKIEFIINHLQKVKADKKMIEVVFTNLINNAVKYTGECDKARIELGSELKDKDNEIQFYIKDNGVGFDMKYKDKLFGTFQRLHTDEKFKGTGIGLATVKRIISKHGGSVWAESEVDKGANFYFTLPINKIYEDVKNGKQC